MMLRDISEAEIANALGGQIDLPDDPTTRLLKTCWILHQLEAVCGKDRVRQCVFSGGFGAGETDRALSAALRELGAFNAHNPEGGKLGIVAQLRAERKNC